MNNIEKIIANLSAEKLALLKIKLKNKNTIKYQKIPLRSTNDLITLSFAQERLWFLAQLEEASATYNMSGAIRLSGNLNLIALQQALSEVVRRHEVLRTSFVSIKGTPVQVVNPEATLKLKLVDLQNEEASERETLVQQQAKSEAITPFNLEIAPLIRCSLLQLDTTESVLLLTMHHIISDGWSIGILLRELSVLYSAYNKQEPSPLPELKIQYADFAVWQRQHLSDRVIQTQLDYWQKQLEGLPELLQLPTDRPRPAVQTYRGQSYQYAFNSELTQKLKALAQRSGTTLFMVLQAVLAVLLYRYSGQPDIAIGSPIANRNRTEIEPLIGFFVNTLVLRTRLEDNPNFEELLTQVRETTLAAYKHQDVPFEKVVEALRPERSLSHSPLFQVMLVLQNAPMSELELPDVTLTLLETESVTAKFDLTLSMTETLSGLTGEWEYNTDLFDSSTIERMASHFQNLLEASVENPQQKVSELPLLSQAERHQLLVQWNNTQTGYPKDKCIHELFEEQVEKTPDAVAVIFENQQLTYSELNQRANQLAHYLQTIGVKPEVLVGICIERSIEMIVGLLGILKADGAYVPLDSTYPSERLANMLSDSQPLVLLTQQHLVESLPEHQAQVVCLDSDWSAIANQSRKNLASEVTAENLAYVIYTSGSTGKPKGVSIAHNNLLNLVFWHQRAFEVNLSDRATQIANIAFDASVWEIWPYLAAGASLCLVETELLTSPLQLQDWLILKEVTIAFLPTPLAEELFALEWSENTALRNMLVGGDRLYQFPSASLPFKIINNYGPTENTVVTTSGRVVNFREDTGWPPIGRPISNTQIYILDPHLQPVPIGVPGELHIGGAGLARAYLNRPELTKQKFIPNPFSGESGVRLYKTGDLARYLPDGNIEFLGRLDNQVKIRGFRIELGEIEAVIAQHPAVRETVVVVRKESTDSQRLVAYVVARPEATLTITEVREFLASKLPSYMIPSAFVTLEALPLTPNGKVDRKALPTPNWAGTKIEETFVAPRTPAEELIADIWIQVLGVEQVGVYENFFELGGHSILATQIISRLHNTFQVEFPLHQLFETPTVAALAEYIETFRLIGQGLQALPPITPIQRRHENLPLSFAQQRSSSFERLSNPLSHVVLTARLMGALNVVALKQSLNEIVRRHEVLRTIFVNVEKQPEQIILPEQPLLLPVIDLSKLVESERETEAQCLALEEALRPFDLTQGPLVRSILVQLSEEEYVILLTVHHIVFDGWSLGILIQELAALYKAFSTGMPSPLPALPIQYVDFAYWQQHWLQGAILEANFTYWKDQLADVPLGLELSTKWLRSPIQAFQGASQSFALSAVLTKELKALSRREGATLFMSLLAAFKILLYHYTGQEDILVSSPSAGRNRVETEGLIGFFTNVLLLRTNLSGNPTFRQLLKQVREVVLNAYAHQDIPFAKLRELLYQKQAMSQVPQLLGVKFSFESFPTQTLALPGLEVSPIEVNTGLARGNLVLFMVEREDKLSGRLSYNTSLFNDSTIAQIIAHFRTLLENVVAEPNQQVALYNNIKRLRHHNRMPLT